MLRINIRGKYSKRNDEILNKIVVRSKSNMVRLGESTANYMKMKIRTSVIGTGRGSTGNLANSIKYYIEGIKDMITVGVGLISSLPIYWRAQNYGSKHLVGKIVPGHFEGERPQAGKSGQKFTYQRKTFRMEIKKPIKAMNFVEHAAMLGRALILSLFRR